MYTMTPDRFFVIDHHPAEAGVVIAAGLSGHGFKFTPVIAEIICQLLLDGRAELPIDFLSLTRAIERQES
jgi:glycine/D-amino acid oxidase-like deaminating enzyme